jgi:hypothetical protein
MQYTISLILSLFILLKHGQIKAWSRAVKRLVHCYIPDGARCGGATLWTGSQKSPKLFFCRMLVRHGSIGIKVGFIMLLPY